MPNIDSLLNVSEILNVVRGQFSPSQLSAYLNMGKDEILEMENYVVMFHERFHYLETIFTPYGHLKWSSYRTVTAETIDNWLSLTEHFSSEKKIPIAEYLNNPTKNDIKILFNIWMHDWIYQVFPLFEKAHYNESLKKVMKIENEYLGPIITLGADDYQIKGIDVLESFAKFQEVMLGALIGYKDLSETLDVRKLNPEYYSALYYFIEKVGTERISEFPIACELALAICHLPKPDVRSSFLDFSIGYRYSVIIEYIANHSEIKNPDIFSDKAFYDYANNVLVGCGFGNYEVQWELSEKYNGQTNLNMAKEMERAIKYKKENPWCLSFPFRTIEDFSSTEFNSFYPIFTITNDSVMYNLNNITPTEMIFENHFQALSMQICGKMSSRCLYPKMLQCGFSYFGTNNCPHQLSGECDGHIDKDSVLPKLEFDSNDDIKSGCTMELVLLGYGTSIREVEIGNMNQQVDLQDISDAIKRIRSN